MAWEFVMDKMNQYNSLCEIGCFNGRITIILSNYLKDKIYFGYDLNFFAITIAKLVNFFVFPRKNLFYCENAVKAHRERSELFVSVGTIIYFSENEFKKFINYLKENKSFKAFVMHEIFQNEEFSCANKSLVEGNLNIHSISMIKDQFGEDYEIKTYRTYYSNWERKGKISAIISIKKK